MGKRKGKRKVVSVDSDDEVGIVAKKSSRRQLNSDSENDDNDDNQEECSAPDVPSSDNRSKERRRIRCLDSSGDEDQVGTPKQRRMKKLQLLSSKLKAKRKVVIDAESPSDSDNDDAQSDYNDDDLPMFEHEDEPPEEAESVDEGNAGNSDLEDFVVNDDNVDEDEEASRLPDSDEEEIKPPQKRSKRNRRTPRKRNKESGSDDDPEDSEDSGSEYKNPYLVDDNDKEDIMAVLRKDTTQDRKNKKNYKKEMGKYQFAVHKESNRGAKVDPRLRFKRNLSTANFDQGLKDDRQLERGDNEYYDYKEINAYGEAVRVFPHTTRVCKFKGRCSLGGCKERFVVGESEIIGAMLLDPFSAKFRKKDGPFGKETFNYVCVQHLPKDDEIEEGDFGCYSSSSDTE